MSISKRPNNIRTFLAIRVAVTCIDWIFVTFRKPLFSSHIIDQRGSDDYKPSMVQSINTKNIRICVCVHVSVYL